MTLPVTVPNTFANATTSIPLANLDANFTTIYAAVNGIGNGSETLANVQVSGGTLSNVTLDNVTVDVETLSNVTLVDVTVTSGNATFTTANATTIDTTDIEVTNIKAKDGTASVSIADSTGVVTLASSVLTTTDINGGTIDGTAIGGSTAAAGSFTTLNTSGQVVFNDAGADVDFRVESDTIDHALFVDGATGNVGIGTSSPDGPLTVVTASDTDGINIRGRTSDNLGSIAFFSNDGSTNYSYIQSNASDTNFSTGGATPLKFGTNNAERMRLTETGGYLRMASGTGGIQFNGDTAAANALDDYEEGTFTPAFTFASGSVTYSTQVGAYTKIGRMVHCTMAFTLSGTSSPSGNVGLSGLPFTSGSGQNFVSGASIGIIRNMTSSNAFIRLYVDQNSTTMSIASNATNAGGTNLQGSEMTSSTLFYFSVTYMTA